MTLLLLTSLGCCSETTLPLSMAPPEKLNLDQTKWRVRGGWVTLPHRDLRKIGRNRLRWISFAKGKALVVKKEDNDARGDD